MMLLEFEIRDLEIDSILFSIAFFVSEMVDQNTQVIYYYYNECIFKFTGVA